MQPNIKRFVIEGAVADTGHFLRKQAHEEMRLKKRMYRDGYVPVLDIVPLADVQFDGDKETFRYAVTIYGVQVDDAQEYEGWLNGQLVTATPKTKLERLSSPSELM
jgi:hypothetical protein